MILQRLREETRAAHDAIERDLEAFGAQRSLDRHRLLAARFFGFYAAWEPQVASSLADERFSLPAASFLCWNRTSNSWVMTGR